MLLPSPPHCFWLYTLKIVSCLLLLFQTYSWLPLAKWMLHRPLRLSLYATLSVLTHSHLLCNVVCFHSPCSPSFWLFRPMRVQPKLVAPAHWHSSGYYLSVWVGRFIFKPLYTLILGTARLLERVKCPWGCLSLLQCQ